MSGRFISSNLNPSNQPRQNLIGIFGLPGSGKTHILNQLRRKLEGGPFSFYEYEEVRKTSPIHWPAYDRAFELIRHKCDDAGVTGIATANYMLPDEFNDHPYTTLLDDGTPNRPFTHIMYVNTPVEVAHQRCMEDAEKNLAWCSLDYFRKWADEEIIGLKDTCFDRKIMFTMVDSHDLPKIIALIHTFQLDRNEEHNQGIVDQCVDEVVAPWQGQVEKVLVMDCDGVFAPKSEEQTFWEMFYSGESNDKGPRALPMRLPWCGFIDDYMECRQLSLAYEQAAASVVALYPEIRSFLHRVSKCPRLRIILVTSRLRLLWERVLAQEGLSQSVKIIGSGPLSNGYIVPPKAKEKPIKRLRTVHNLQVWAFGGHGSDEQMLHRAHYSIILRRPDNPGYNELWLSDVALRLKNSKDCIDSTTFHLKELGEPAFLDQLMQHQFTLAHATHKGVAKLLHTRMLKSIYFPDQRLEENVYSEAGWYLANEYISEIGGIEEAAIAVSEEPKATGYQLVRESGMLIIPLTGSSHQMGAGIRDVFQKACTLQTDNPEDIDDDHLREIDTVVLVEAVADSADVITRYVNHIHRVKPCLPILVVTGILQAELVAPGGPLSSLIRGGPITVVALSLAKGREMTTESYVYETARIS
ncbi:hypothetical protein BO83DRAFT_397208 [Aspergillus eucalypticola CBS 122712]|uniref:Uracil phosphoribosyltransferase n=1 Tax=Aspergillus eucalypticola (strain CBS 122712 / IBT 29274) TaxID=1448314 RepID=A0A317VXM9_ASPEC|nr:uncharacterized protein BO83DRAFT_397208 [Aspergillus eucalypticola CBS 122712]PWY77752.1 hypothetical protein BO83DRAFT_397208 [Aspergillus eucalypticola CBS 122712]